MVTGGTGGTLFLESPYMKNDLYEVIQKQRHHLSHCHLDLSSGIFGKDAPHFSRRLQTGDTFHFHDSEEVNHFLDLVAHAGREAKR